MTEVDINPLLLLIINAKSFVKSITKEKALDYIVNGPKYYGDWWLQQFTESPSHVIIETLLILFIVWLIFIRRTVDPSKVSKTKLSAKEIDWLVDTWQPEPLVPETGKQVHIPIIESVKGKNITVRGVKGSVLNMCSHDFLSLGDLKEVKEKSRQALAKYGCGSCGPRGFYGTIDVHLTFEDQLAKFMGTEEAICYSDGASAVTSCIQAFAKKGDLILCDEGCSEPVRTGCNLSRATIQYFKHNDINDLTSILESVAADDRRLRRDPTQQRRFIIVEGLYVYTGKICPLPQLLELRKKFCYRVFVDESHSFGTLGKNGRGVTEYYGVKATDVDFTLVSMDSTLGAVGGGCVGTRQVVDHQRLSGAGYCFSASCPPFLFAGAIEALTHLQSEGSELLDTLQENIKEFHDAMKGSKDLQVISDIKSPIIHIVLNRKSSKNRVELFDEEQELVEEIASVCLSNGIGITANQYDERLLKEMKESNHSLRASLKVCMNSAFSSADIKKAVKVLKAAAASVL